MLLSSNRRHLLNSERESRFDDIEKLLALTSKFKSKLKIELRKRKINQSELYENKQEIIDFMESVIDAPSNFNNQREYHKFANAVLNVEI